MITISLTEVVSGTSIETEIKTLEDDDGQQLMAYDMSQFQDTIFVDINLPGKSGSMFN
jgi:hypothetical protein